MKIVLPIIQFLTSLFLATQVWAWLRMLGSLWVTDSLYLIVHMLHSVFIFHFGLTSFLFALLPSGLVFASARMSKHKNLELVGYVVIGAALAAGYFVIIYGASIFHNPSILMHGPGILLAGILAAIVFYGAVRLPIWDKEHAQKDSPVDPKRRYLVSGIAVGVGGVGLLGAVAGPARIWWKSDQFVDIDLSKMEEGQHIAVEINQNPVWIIKRSQAMLDSLFKNDIELYDPDSNESLQPDSAKNIYRSIRPEYLVVYPTCTHLGCMVSFRPEGMPEWNSGQLSNKPALFCPCHGGVFDIAGRVVKGTPPPENLKVPDYKFLSDHVIRIHYPSLAEIWSEA